MADSPSENLNLESNCCNELCGTRDARLETRRATTPIFKHGDEPTKAKSHIMGQVGHEPPNSNSADQWLQDQQGSYPLKPGATKLGRLPDNDVVIPGPHVSRNHCTIVVRAGVACELHDNGSRNGTYVNGLKVSGSTKLVSGDVIWICHRRFVFLSKGGSSG